MSFDTHSFDAIEDMYTNYRLRSRKNNPLLTMQIEECVRYQYELHEITASHLNRKLSEYNSYSISMDDKRILLSHSLYTQNVRIIHAAYPMILNGKIYASHILTRRILESILEQYYIGLCNEDEFLEYVQLSEKDHTEITKLGYNFYKQKLYKADSGIFNQMSKIYSQLSVFTHVTWKTLSDSQYAPDLVKDALLNLHQYSLFNVLSHCQVYTFDTAYPQSILESVQPFIDEQLLNSDCIIDPIFPNKPADVIDRLCWHPDKQ